MTKLKVYAPNEAYAGSVGSVAFIDGEAEVDSDSKEMAYFHQAGYHIGKRPSAKASAEDETASAEAADAAAPGEPWLPDTVDARAYDKPIPFGTPLRDAAVDPHPEDFLPPTNAGEANPHGPLVVAPGIHAGGPAPIRPGEVFVDDTDRQAAEETALAQAVLVDGEPATSAAVEFDGTPDKGNMGPLGLSDPGSVTMGVAAAGSQTAPARSANKTDWVAYAISRGMSEEDAKAAGKAELIERLGS